MLIGICLTASKGLNKNRMFLMCLLVIYGRKIFALQTSSVSEMGFGAQQWQGCLRLQ